MAFNQPEELILLSTQTASNSASLTFTSLITSTYPVYYVKIRSIVPATDVTSLLMTYSTDNGSTYLATNYLWSLYHYTSNNVRSQTSSTSDSSIILAQKISKTSSKDGVSINLDLFGFGQSIVANIQGQGVLKNIEGYCEGFMAGGLNTTTTAINAIKFAMSSGNITSGSISLYGMMM